MVPFLFPRTQKQRFSFLNILTGSDLSSRRLPLVEMKSGKPGPTVWLTACVHGDEIGGVVVIQEILKLLRAHPLEKGSLFAFPLMNPIGFEAAARSTVLSKEDLNRSFPGNEQGTLAERIAEKIFSTITRTRPALVLDFHNDWQQSIPYALIDPYPGQKQRDAYEKVKHFAEMSGLLMVNEREDAEDTAELRKTLSGSLLIHGIPAVTFELGGASFVGERHVADGVSSTLRILMGLGMVKHMDSAPLSYPAPAEFHGKVLRYSHQPTASKSGIARFLAYPGKIVRAGEPVARIYDVFGKPEETLQAKKDAVVLGCADSSAAFPGMEFIAFAELSS